MNRFFPTIISAAFMLIASTAVAQAADYANSTFGFSFEYPRECSIESSSDYSFSISCGDGGAISGEVERLGSYPRSLYGSLEDPFRDFGVARALLQCSADGPDGSAYCPSVESLREFETASGIRAIELFLNHVQELYGENPERTETVVGPLYLLDVASGGGMTVLIIGGAPWERMTGGQKSLSESIVGTLKKLPR